MQLHLSQKLSDVLSHKCISNNHLTIIDFFNAQVQSNLQSFLSKKVNAQDIRQLIQEVNSYKDRNFFFYLEPV